MALNEDKIKKMQDEMSRFEEEIGLPLPEIAIGPGGPRIIGANTYNEAKKTLAGIPGTIIPGELMHPVGLPPPPPPPPNLPFIPPQVRGIPPMDGVRMQFSSAGLFRGALPPPPPMPPGPLPPHLTSLPPGFGLMGPMGAQMPPQMMPPSFPGPPAPSFQPMNPPRFAPPPPQPEVKPPPPAATVLSATPMMYVSNPQLESPQQLSSSSTESHQTETSNGAEEMKKLLHVNKKKPVQPIIETTFTPVQVSNPSKKKEKKNKKLIRLAGGQTWEDPTLAEWEDDDFRLFCGDLGNDVTDEVLTRAFSKYPSFLKSKVVRDKRTNKTKGFGFVSFKDPQDFIRATKEMNGRYVGSRPIKLRKSSWRNRSLEVVKKKDKEKTNLINMLTGR